MPLLGLIIAVALGTALAPVFEVLLRILGAIILVLLLVSLIYG